MHHFWASLPKCVLTPPKEISSHIFKMAIFPKFFEAFMSHIIRKNTGKKTKLLSELFTNKFFENSFVLFVSKQSLNHSSVYTVFCLHGCFFNVSKIRVSRGPPVYEFNLYLVGPSSQNSKTGILDWIEIDFIFLWYWLKCHKFDSSFAIKCIPLLGDPQFSKGQSSFVEASVRFRRVSSVPKNTAD